MTACAENWSEGNHARETVTGSSRDYIGAEPPVGRATRNGTGDHERKLAVIAVSKLSTRESVMRDYAKRGYQCLPCNNKDQWATESNLFYGSENATLVTDDLELIWRVRLHDLHVGTSVPVHAVVQSNELFAEAQALTLGATEIVEADEELDTDITIEFRRSE